MNTMSDQEQATSNFKGKGKEQTSSNINNMTSSIGAMSGKSRKPPPLHRNNVSCDDLFFFISYLDADELEMCYIIHI